MVLFLPRLLITIIAGRKIFEKVFKTDIERLLSMEDLWKTRSKPSPLNLEKIEKKVSMETEDIGASF